MVTRDLILPAVGILIFVLVLFYFGLSEGMRSKNDLEKPEIQDPYLKIAPTKSCTSVTANTSTVRLSYSVELRRAAKTTAVFSIRQLYHDSCSNALANGPAQEIFISPSNGWIFLTDNDNQIQSSPFGSITKIGDGSDTILALMESLKSQYNDPESENLSKQCVVERVNVFGISDSIQLYEVRSSKPTSLFNCISRAQFVVDDDTALTIYNPAIEPEQLIVDLKSFHVLEGEI